VGSIGSLRNTVPHCPIHSVLIIAAGGYIHKHAGLGVAVGFHKDDLDGMGSADILKGVGLHRADALAIDLDVGDGIALIWGDCEGLISALTDADAAGGRDGAASTGSCLDGVVAVAAASTAIVAPLSRDGQVFGGHGGRDGRGPPCEGVAGLGGIGGGGDGSAVVLGDGRDGTSAVGVEGEGVLVHGPLSLDGHILGGHGGRDGRGPARKRVAGLGGIGGGGDGGAVVLGDRRDGAAAVGVEGEGVAGRSAACAAIAQNRQRVGFSADLHDNVGCAAVGDGNGCAAAGGQSLSVDAHGLSVSRHRCD